MATPSPHPLNVPGDFYVEIDCCLFCGVPQEIAPGLFSPLHDNDDSCYVRKQPETAHELDQMIEVMEYAELQCIHYRGDDLEVQARLQALGEFDQCDYPAPELLPKPSDPSCLSWVGPRLRIGLIIAFCLLGLAILVDSIRYLASGASHWESTARAISGALEKDLVEWIVILAVLLVTVLFLTSSRRFTSNSS